MLRFYRREGRQVGLGSEAGPHVVGDQIEDGHGGKTEDQFNRLEHALVRVEDGIDLTFAGVGAGDKGRGAVAVHMIDPVLGIVLDNEDCHFRPEFRLAQAFDDLTKREVVVGNHRFWGGGSGCRSIGVV